MTRSGASTGQWDFSYDAVGNRETTQANGDIVHGTFDVANRLTALSGGGTLRFRGTLNERGTVTVAGQSARMTANNGFEADVTVVPGTNTVSVTATDASGNPVTHNYRVDVTGTDATLQYDLNGNLASKTEGGVTWTYEWTAQNQLKRVLSNGVEVARFQYDPLGRRAEKVAGGITYSYAYDGLDILREARSNGTTYTYVHGPGIDEPLARIDQVGTVAYYHADGLGSIAAMTNAAGAVVSTKRYDAWGNLEVGASEPGYAFTGREWDPETGLYYYRARYYDPKVGRFISEDPIGFAGGTNFYAYVGGRATSFTDPTGTIECFYDVTGGTMRCFGNHGTEETLSIPVASGNNGGGQQCKNNPDCEGIVDHGPIPRGVWNWTDGATSRPNGRVLEPAEGTDAQGRTQIVSHSCANAFGPSTTSPYCSEGCVTGSVTDIQALNVLIDADQAAGLPNTVTVVPNAATLQDLLDERATIIDWEIQTGFDWASR